MILTLLTYDAEQAAADLVAELLEDRNLDLPHSTDEPYSNETMEAMEEMVLERSQINDESLEEDYPPRIVDIQAFEGIVQYSNR